MSAALTDGVVPLIARIAGYPAETMAPFGGGECSGAAERLADLERQLAAERRQLVDELHRAVPGAAPAQRRFLLEVKRDSFNGRGLARHRGHAQWGALAEAVGPLADRILHLERTAAAAASEYERGFAEQRRRERLYLAGFANDPILLRGMALGSIVLVENLPRLARTPPDEYGRKERRLQESLLRYVSRAALKLSPFSSLTRVALGVAGDGLQSSFLLGAGAWQERSLVCLRRFLLDQYSNLLVLYEPFRQRLPVVLNDTVERLPGERYRFLRAGFWSAEPAGAELQYQRPALVEVRLAGPIIDWLLEHAVSPRWTLPRLLEELGTELPHESAAALAATLDKLLAIGFLRYVLPWATDDLHLEKRVLAHFGAQPGDPALGPFVDLLRRIVRLLEGYAEATDPAAAVAEGKRMIDGVLATLAPLADLDPGLRAKSTDRYFQEDVLLYAATPESPSREVVQIPLEQARRVLRSIEPLARLSNLDSTRYDFLHTLGAFAAERWPDRDEVGFLELFEASHRLFQDYVRFEIEARSFGTLRAPAFNPMSLPAIERLRGWRLHVAERLERCVEPHGGEMRLDRDAMNDLLDQVPSPYADRRDFCAFLQPLDSAGRAWVLNALFEGSGRLSSRYTPVMDESMRRLWVDYYQRHSTYWHEDELVELVDLFCPAGHTLNVHAPQTHRVLEIPGESSGLPLERLIRLRDVRTRLRGSGRFPQLTDASGRRILPVHLGGLVFRFMPNLLKFLTIFGPGEFRFRAPSKGRRRVGDLEVQERHRVDDVVFRRRTWIFEVAPLRTQLRGMSEAQAFRTVHEWRVSREIPEHVYLIEPLAGGVPRPQTKPQYVDFTSPLFVEMFRSILDLDVPTLAMAEALPDAEQFPRGQDGKRWGVELQLENLGLLFPQDPFAEREESTYNGPLWATMKGDVDGRTEGQVR